MTLLQYSILALGFTAAFLEEAAVDLIEVGVEEVWLNIVSKALTLLVTGLGAVAAGKLKKRG